MKLLRRREPIRPDLAAALERLDHLAETAPELSAAATLQGAILRVLARVPPQTGTLDLPADRAAAKLHDGLPLLRGEQAMLDLPGIQALMLQLCQAIREHDETADAAAAIAAAIERRALSVAELVQDVLGGQAASIRGRAAERGLDADMVCMLLRFSMFPALERLAAQLAPLRASTIWQHGYCPTCGSWPLLGEHRGLEQTRFLRCGLCATEWAIDRVLCPFCGNRNHDDLSYLHVEGHEHKRAATCEQCRSYIKMLASLVPIPAIELAIYDLATIHLDMVALERGYAAPI
jgi:FdhE protein